MPLGATHHEHGGGHVPAYSSMPTEQESGAWAVQRDGNLVSKGSIDSTPHRRRTDLRTSGPERVETGNENPHHPMCWNKRWASAENVFPEKEFRANSYAEKLSLWKDWGAGQCWTPLEGGAQEGLWGHRHLGFPFIDSPNVIFPINREH